MTLLNLSGPEAIHFLKSGSGPSFVFELQSIAWSSLSVRDESLWSDAVLRDILFRLQGGLYVGANPSDAYLLESCSNGPGLCQQTEIIQQLFLLDREGLLDLFQSTYLGPMLAYVPGQGVSVLSVVGRVVRTWSVFSSSPIALKRKKDGEALDGLTIYGSPPVEIKPLLSTLSDLGLTNSDGRPFKGPGVTPIVGKRRLLKFFRECNPANTVNGLLCSPVASLEEGLALFHAFWSKDLVEGLDNAEALAITNFIGVVPTISAAAVPTLLRVLESVSNRPPPLGFLNTTPEVSGIIQPPPAMTSREAPQIPGFGAWTPASRHQNQQAH